MEQEIRVTYSVPADWSLEKLIEEFTPAINKNVDLVMIEEERHIYGNAELGDVPWRNNVT